MFTLLFKRRILLESERINNVYYFSAVVLLFLEIPTIITINSKLVPLVRDDNYSTCAVFTSDMAMPWFTDFSLPVSYFNHSVTATVELFGDNVGCSSGDDGKLFIFPISSWNESAGMFGPRKTCSFQESSTIVETGQQKCAYNCTFSQQTVALRVIKRPHSEVQSGWQLCEVSNLFYGMLIKRNSRNTNDNFRIGVSFDCVKSNL